jgi:hypothetical protein
MKYTINTPKCIEKCIKILWCLLKYIHQPLKIHSYVLIYIHIPFKYITIPSKYIIEPSKNLTHFWHILQYHYYTLIFFHIPWNCSKTSLFRTSLSSHYIIFHNYHGASLFYENVIALAMTCLLESKNEAFSMNPINLIG